MRAPLGLVLNVPVNKPLMQVGCIYLQRLPILQKAIYRRVSNGMSMRSMRHESERV